MANKGYFLTLITVFLGFLSFGQTNMNWYNPIKENAVLGRVKGEGLTAYNRLPDALKKTVRGEVWSLGTNSAGLYLRFTTDADSLVVRYKVTGGFSMPHMPTIGVSGVDLYAHNDKQGGWQWAAGNYSFGDTTHYSFLNLGNSGDRVYELYLPLYNTVSWMEIGVPNGKTISFKQEDRKPIVIYGTSITQGACASRPGLAWTNILSREIQAPIINLGFSGNGRLEQPILELMVAQDPAVFVLDCLPNLTVNKSRSAATLDSLIMNAVQYIRSEKPNTPIIFTETGAGFNPTSMNIGYGGRNETTTQVARETLKKLKKAGYKNIYTIKNPELGMGINTTVDDAHPNDIGMKKIADAYRKALKRIAVAY